VRIQGRKGAVLKGDVCAGIHTTATDAEEVSPLQGRWGRPKELFKKSYKVWGGLKRGAGE